MDAATQDRGILFLVGLSVPVFRPVVKLADDLVVHDQGVHEVVGEVVEADAPGFAVDFGNPWIIDIVRIAPIQVVR